MPRHVHLLENYPLFVPFVRKIYSRVDWISPGQIYTIPRCEWLTKSTINKPVSWLLPLPPNVTLRSTYFFCSPKISGCLKYVWLIVQQEQDETMLILYDTFRSQRNALFFSFSFFLSTSTLFLSSRALTTCTAETGGFIFLVISSIDAMFRIYLIWKYLRLLFVERTFPRAKGF